MDSFDSAMAHHQRLQAQGNTKLPPAMP